MAVGIEKTLATLTDLKALAVDGIELAKKGPWGLGSLSRVLTLLGDIRALAADAVQVLPELSDLDAEETGKVGSAAFVLVKAILTAVVA